MKNPDLMTPTEVIECVIRAAEKGKQPIYAKIPGGHKHFNLTILDVNVFIQSLKNELT